MSLLDRSLSRRALLRGAVLAALSAAGCAELPRLPGPPPAPTLPPLLDRALAVSPALRVDQVGYPPLAPKVAKSNRALEEFQVVAAASNRVVFRDRPRRVYPDDEASGETVYDLDFSGVTQEGLYYLAAPEIGRTQAFRVAGNAYADAARVVLRGFYFQRCGTPIDGDAVWSRPTCHTHDAAVWGLGEGRVDTTGGWHDAGDYGKYVVSAAMSVGLLLLAHELFPERFLDGGPGSGPGAPGLLDEVRWEMEWLLKMQAPEGGVYHKVANDKWSGEFLPQADRNPRYVSDISSSATAYLAAVAASAYRAYLPQDRAFAARCLDAAERAWHFLDEHRTTFPAGGFKNPPEVSTAAYTKESDLPERFWAAAELTRIKGSGAMQYYVEKGYRVWDPLFQKPFDWVDLHHLGVFTYLLGDGTDRATRGQMLGALQRDADAIVQRTTHDAYTSSLRPSDYTWASNGLLLNNAVELIVADHLAPNPGFRRAALDHLHYVLGRNPMSISYVTGVGTDPVRSPYHSWSIAAKTGQTIPGLLSGGPNRYEGANLSPFAAKAFVDDDKSYVTNETAININAALAFVTAYFADGEVVK